MKKLLLITIFLVTSLSSQEWAKYDLEDLNINLDLKDPYDLDFDRDNNLWIASLSGLLKFDGNDWIVYDTTSSDIGWNKLFSVAVDRDNNIWVGKSERNGLSIFDGQDWVHINEDNTPELDLYTPRDIVFDKNNTIWLATEYYLWTNQNNRWFSIEHTEEYDGLKSFVSEVVFDKSNNIWFTTRFDGLYKVSNNSLQKNSIGSVHRYEGLAIDSSNNVWFINGSNSLMHYNQTTKQWTVRDTTVTPLHNNFLRRNIIAVDRHNNLWIAEDRSVHYFNTIDETWKTYTIPESLQPINSPVSFNGFKIDNHGSLWFISQSAGVFKLSGVISSVEDEEPNTQITLYPNPADNFLRMEHNQTEQFTKYVIIDLNGKRMLSGQFNSTEIDISTLSSGVYVIKLFDLFGHQAEKKFVVE